MYRSNYYLLQQIVHQNHYWNLYRIQLYVDVYNYLWKRRVYCQMWDRSYNSHNDYLHLIL